MRILVTGDTGYVGTVLCEKLQSNGYNVTGLDLDFFLENDLVLQNRSYKRLNKDINKVHEDDLRNIDTIIHLAGLSNDPLGELDEELTYKINFDGTINLIDKAKIAGVKFFICFHTKCLRHIRKY